MSNTEPPRGDEDEQAEYYPGDEDETDSPPLDPSIPTAEGDPHEGP